MRDNRKRRNGKTNGRKKNGKRNDGKKSDGKKNSNSESNSNELNKHTNKRTIIISRASMDLRKERVNNSRKGGSSPRYNKTGMEPQRPHPSKRNSVANILSTSTITLALGKAFGFNSNNPISTCNRRIMRSHHRNLAAYPGLPILHLPRVLSRSAM